MAKLFSKLNRLVAIDLGTERTRIWSDKRDLILEEPSYIAVDMLSKKVLAVGNDALEMKGRIRKNVSVFSPIHGGKIYDFDLVRAMLRVFLQDVFKTFVD